MSGMRSALTLRMMSTPPVLSSATWVATSGIDRKTRCLNAGFPRQCWSNASSRTCWSRFHSTSFQGPVPTVAVLPNASAPTFSTCFFGTMGKNTRRSSSSGNGLSVIRWIVSGLTIFTSLIARMLPYCGDFFFSLPGSSTRSNGELHVLGGHGRAVVELDALAELELPRRVVERLPRQGQRGLELELGAAVQERVEHVDVDEDADALEVHVRVEGLGVRRERDGERVLALGGDADRHGDERGESQGHEGREANAS